jgi:hypothetical protein
VAVAATTQGAEGSASRGSAREACHALLAALAAGQDDLAAVERAIAGEMVARDGFSSPPDLPRADAHWVQAFLEAPRQVLLHAIAVRLLSDVTLVKGAATDSPAATCVPIGSGDDTRTPSFHIATLSGERTWTFGWEQQWWKLIDGSLSSAGRRPSIFEENSGSKGPRKKWTPSLK